jgi:predicted extracellular nuclease
LENKELHTMKKAIVLAILAVGLSAPAHAQLIFTQYYEGTSNNKFVELKNLGTDPIDLSLYTISTYSNANAEDWKTGIASTNTFGIQTLSGTLAAGEVYLIANSSAVLPDYAVTGADLSSSAATNFNGNDSITLWTGATYTSTSQLVDVLSFTNLGNEGKDTSFVRLNANVGWDLTTGSNITQFSSVWASASLTDVADATSGTDTYLGSSTVAAVPEPGTVALVGVGLGAVLLGMRRRRAQA